MASIRAFPNEGVLFPRARELGKELCQSISEKRVYPEQAALRAGIRYRMSGLVEFMKEHWPFEREQWEKKGRTA